MVNHPLTSYFKNIQNRPLPPVNGIPSHLYDNNKNVPSFLISKVTWFQLCPPILRWWTSTTKLWHTTTLWWTWFAANSTKLLYLCLVDKVWAALPLATQNKRFFAQVITVKTVRMLMRRRRWRKELKRWRKVTLRWRSQRGKVHAPGQLSSLGKWKPALERVALLEEGTSIAASIQSVESRKRDSVDGSSSSWVRVSQHFHISFYQIYLNKSSTWRYIMSCSGSYCSRRMALWKTANPYKR